MRICWWILCVLYLLLTLLYTLVKVLEDPQSNLPRSTQVLLLTAFGLGYTCTFMYSNTWAQFGKFVRETWNWPLTSSDSHLIARYVVELLASNEYQSSRKANWLTWRRVYKATGSWRWEKLVLASLQLTTKREILPNWVTRTSYITSLVSNIPLLVTLI